jgi:hypothetical protein
MGSLANGMGRTDAFAARFRNGGSWRNSEKKSKDTFK